MNILRFLCHVSFAVCSDIFLEILAFQNDYQSQ